MNLISIFEKIRDIPYKIQLKWEEEDFSCYGKHLKLFDLLKKEKYEIRYRVCTFFWDELNLPLKLKQIPHSKECLHSYLEIKINNQWKTLDASWDIGLKNIFHVNKWNGKSNTKIAVNPIEVYDPQQSLEIIQNENKEIIEEDLKNNGKFYKTFNEWLEKNRISNQ